MLRPEPRSPCKFSNIILVESVDDDADRSCSDLYADKHPTTKQFVMTWKAQEITEKFHGDVYPLIDYILTAGNSSYPTSDDYLGSFGMGTEAYDSPSNVTFYCPDFAVNVE